MDAQAAWGLAIDSGGDEFSVSGTTPRLSWRLPADLVVQSRYELEFVVDGARDGSGPVASVQHLFVPWPGPALSSRQRVQWRVRVGDAETWRTWSEWSYFEVGLLPAEWVAQWISPPEDELGQYGERPAYALSRSVRVREGLRSARLYSTALGVYEAYVNGERQGKAELLPGTTTYTETLYAQAFDVTDSLAAGDNDLSLVVSDGWYRGQVGAFRVPAGWGETLGVRAQLHLEYEDGSSEVIVSDGQWVSSLTSIVRADLMAGQWTDFSFDPQGSRPVIVGQVSAPEPTWSPAPPVRIVETRSPVSVEEVRPGIWVADFGQNASGWIRLTNLGPAGTETIIDYGEFVGHDGDLDTTHLNSERQGADPQVFVQQDRVVSDGGDRVFEPRHTIHGFRYARLSREGGSPISAEDMRMCIVHSDLARAGSFESSNDDFNRLFQVADWSFRGNAVDVPTDCPTRERLPWTGDYQVFAPTAVRLFDVLGFTRKWLQSVRDDQLPDGRISNFAPDGRRIALHPDDHLNVLTGSSGWGDAIVAVPWEMYQAYGDRSVLADNWDAARRWVEWVLEKARTERHHSRQQRSAEPAEHEAYLWDGTFHWGEWLEPKEKREDGTPIDPFKDNPMEWFMADKGEVGTAYLYRSATIMSQTAAVLGFDDEQARYAEIADRVREAWRTEYLLGDGRTVADTQASYVRALEFGLIPEELRADSASRLVQLIAEAGGHLSTGFLSTGYLLPVLADAGYPEVAYELLQQRQSPSWLYMLDQGATTIWEDWDGIDANGVAHESLNHYSKGAVVRFFLTHTLGLRQVPGSVAWERFEVAPVPGASLTWARGRHESPQGPIAVAWQIADGQMTVDVDVPPMCEAVIRFPSGGEVLAGPGRTSATHSL